jgi:hypothetical protein
MKRLRRFIKRLTRSFDRKFWWFFTNGNKYDQVRERMKRQQDHEENEKKKL